MTDNELIKQYRIRNRITQARLANHLGFTGAHMNQLENTDIAIKPEKVKRIIRAINELATPNIPAELTRAVNKVMNGK